MGVNTYVRVDRQGALAPPVDARVFEGRVARIHHPGDALKYQWGEEHRDATELAKVVGQLIGKPVTLAHPSGMVSEGAHAHVVGEIISARVDGEFAVARFLITDDAALAAIESGIHELSLGYQCSTNEFGYQQNTRIDHLAIVPKGRCSRGNKTCELRADHAQECSCVASSLDVYHSGNDMADAAHTTPARPSVDRDDDLQKQLANALAEVAAQKTRADEAEKALADANKVRTDADIAAHEAVKNLETEKSRADRAEAAIEAVRADGLEAASKQKAEHDELTNKLRADHAAELATKVAEKVALIAQATPILGNIDPATEDRDIKLAVIKHVDGDDLSAKPAEWVNGVYEGALKRHSRVETSREDAREALAGMRQAGNAIFNPTNTGRNAEKQALNQFRNRLTSQWMSNKDKE